MEKQREHQSNKVFSFFCAYSLLTAKETNISAVVKAANSIHFNLDNKEYSFRLTSFKRNEKIFCFETNMIYNSAKEASLKTGANKSHIHRCCKKLENGSNGLHFCYLQDKDNFVLNPTMKRADNFTNQENLLLKQKYPFMGISNKLLELFPNRTLGSLRQQAHRLNLKYIGENKGNKKVLCVELNKKFNSIEDAYRYVNLKDGSSISRCCQGKRNTAAGYHWEYIENIKKD